MWIALKRIIRLGWLSFTRDGGVVIATCFVLVLTISLITSLFLLEKVSQFLIEKIEEKVDISVYFKEKVKEIDILDVKEELTKIPQVKNVKYVSKAEALEEFIKRHEKDPVLMRSLEEVGVNPFLASLNVKASDPGEYEAISNFLEDAIFGDLIEKVDYHQRKPVIERVFSLTSAMEKFGLGLSLLLALLSFLIVLNTIRLAILNSAEEIKIQRLVGASNWFIRGPFLIQGVISGVSAAFVSFLILALTCWILNPKVEYLFPELSLWQYFTSSILVILLIQLATGIFLGTVSSTMAIRKYLKV